MPKDEKQNEEPRISRRTIVKSTAAVGGTMLGPRVSAQPTPKQVTDGPNEATTSFTYSSSLDDPPTVLLIKDCVPWDANGNEEALDILGYDYDVISSSDAVESLPDYDGLDDIDVILVPSTQNEAYYEDLNSIWDIITQFVQRGGVLVVHAGELGWPCNVGDGGDDSLLSFPRGVSNDYTFLEAPGEEVVELQELTVNNSSHPIVDGLNSEDLSYWASDISSFGYYSGVPLDAEEIVGLEIDPDLHPTYIEYPYGQGILLTTMQPPEWPFGPSNRDGTEQLLLNELEYAVETAGDINPPPEEARIRGAVVDASDNPVDSGTAHLIDPVNEAEVIEYINDNAPLPQSEHEAVIDAGEFLFDEINAGRRIVLVDLPDSLDPEYEFISAPTEETTEVSFSVDEQRYLSHLDAEAKRLINAAETAINDSTENVASVYVDGSNYFSDDLGSEDYLSGALSAVNFALDLADGPLPPEKTIANFILSQTALTVSDGKYNDVLAEKWEGVEGTVFEDDLSLYSEKCTSEDWIMNQEASATEPVARAALRDTSMFESATEAIEQADSEYENLAYQEPDDDFSLSETKRVLQTQARWLENNGLAPGVVITPQGAAYVTQETEYHRGHYENLRSEIETTETLELASQGISAAGGTLSLVSGGTAAPVGAVASIAGSVSELAFAMYQVYLKNQLADTWAETLIRWLSDLDDVAGIDGRRGLIFELFDSEEGWLQEEVTEPSLQDTNGEIESTDIGGVQPPFTDETFAVANKPDYPLWWEATPLPKPKWKSSRVNTVEVKNTGSTETDFQISNIDMYGDSSSEGISDSISFYPRDFDDEGSPLSQGEIREIDIGYSSDFHWYSPFSWHHMTTTLWMNGKDVDTMKDIYYIVPTWDVIPFSEKEEDTLSMKSELANGEALDRPLETDTYVLTDGSKNKDEPLTVEDWADNVGEITNVIDGSVSQGTPTVERQYHHDTGSRGVVFVLSSSPDANLNMHVRDEAGRQVGYSPEEDDDVVEIPGAEYNGHESTIEVISIDDATGSYSVEVEGVRFLSNNSVPVSVYAVQVPERDSILGLSPTTVTSSIKPGSDSSAQVAVSETGGQENIEVTGVSVGDFKRSDGEPLPDDVVVSVSENEFVVPAGQDGSVELSFNVPAEIDLPDGPDTRFWADITVETETSGVMTLDASLFIFDPDAGGVRLNEAETDIRGLSVSKTPENNLPNPPGNNINVINAYEIESVGEGMVSLTLPLETDQVNIEKVSAYRIEDGVWEEINISPGNRATVEVESSENPFHIVVSMTDADHPSGVSQEVWKAVTNQNSPTDELTSDDLNDAVDAYQNDNQVGSVEVSLQDLIDLIRWHQG